MTTRDIAKKAGVSPSSVSRYFTGAENLSEEIKRKIEAVIGAEAVDQAALRKAPNLIVLAIPHMRLEYYKELMCLFTEVAPLRNMQAVFLPIFNVSADKLRAKLVKLKPDGLVIFEEDSRYSLKKIADSLNIPTMLCGELSYYEEALTAVHVNDSLAAYEGTKYLLSLGHKDIVFFSNHGKGVDASFQRLSGCQKAMAEAGLSFGEPYVRYAPLRYESGYNLAKGLIKDKLSFTAIFAFSDEMAHGAMDALLDSGLKIPEDVSVLGFDDLPLAERIRPKLTTIHQPLDLIVSEILNYFSIPVLQEKGREILLKHSFVMRDSCMALPEKGGKNE